MTTNSNNSGNQQQYTDIETHPAQEKMMAEFVEVLFQASNIEKEFLKSKLTEAFIDWQNITKKPISAAVKMEPQERVRMTHIVADIFREKMSKYIKSKSGIKDSERDKLVSSINGALDKVLKYYEDLYLYRK